MDKEEVIKKCPFLKEWCIREQCVLYQKMIQVVNGLPREQWMCSYLATDLLLSEMNLLLSKMMQQQGQQKKPGIYLPGVHN